MLEAVLVCSSDTCSGMLSRCVVVVVVAASGRRDET